MSNAKDIDIPEAEEAVNKRIKTEETTEFFMPSALERNPVLPAQGSKTAMLHQRPDTTEPFARKRTCHVDTDEPEESINEIAETPSVSTTTNVTHGGNNNNNNNNGVVSQAVKKLMIAMAEFVAMVERPTPTVAAAAPPPPPHGHSRDLFLGQQEQSKMLLHTSRRMAELAVEVVSIRSGEVVTETAGNDDKTCI